MTPAARPYLDAADLAAIPQNDLAPLYARWMADCLGGPIPRETTATCAECAMAVPGKDRPPGPYDSYSPDLKCCTFTPALANFLAGNLLADPDPGLDDGRRTLEARIDARVAVTPAYVHRRATWIVEYFFATFGRTRAFRCQHFSDDGRCLIWRYREATCSTFFCKHDRGAVGSRFWRALYTLLTTVEAVLAMSCVRRLDPGERALARLYPENRDPKADDPEHLDGARDPEGYAEVWGRYLGREREFYVECARLVNGLSWADVRRIGSGDLEIAEAAARAAYADYSQAGPFAADGVPLKLIQIKKLTPDGDRTWATTYSAINPLSVPSSLLRALRLFDGRPNAEALAAVEAETGRPLDPALYRKLCDHEVLEPETSCPLIPGVSRRPSP